MKKPHPKLVTTYNEINSIFKFFQDPRRLAVHNDVPYSFHRLKIFLFTTEKFVFYRNFVFLDYILERMVFQFWLQTENVLCHRFLFRSKKISFLLHASDIVF